jgi:lysophospholipase L1-like esterase
MKSMILVGLMAMAGWAGAAEPQIRIVLAGDSTVTDKSGWGRAFAERLAPGVTCSNTASGGQSTKSFLDGGRWAKAVALHPTHVLIQFGHNDMPGKGAHRETDPKTTYRANLIRFVEDVRAAGAQPILVTSIPRRSFKDGKLVGELAPYVEAMRAVAAEKKVPLADLYKVSVAAIEKLGPEKSEELGPMGKEGRRDHTHLDKPGQELTAKLLVEELCRVVPELAGAFRKEQPAGEKPAP